MNKRELIDALEALPEATDTAIVVFVLNQDNDATVESVDYEHGEIHLNIDRGEIEEYSF